MDIKLKDGQDIKINIKKSGEIYEYYIKDLRIGVFSPNVMKDNFLVTEENNLRNTLGNELLNQISEGINSIGKEEIEKEAELNEKILKYAKEKDIENIKDITVIDAEKYTIDEKEDEIIENKEESEESEKETKQVTKRDVNIKQEVALDEKANDMHDFRNWLGGNLPSESDKIVVIESSEINKMKDENGESYDRPSTRYSICVLDKRGEVEPLQKYIPNLRQRASAGSNPTEQKYQVDKNGKVEKDAVYSEYEIGDKILQIDNKEMGRIELNIGQEEHGGNRTIGIQMSDSNSGPTSIQTRSVLGEYEKNGKYVVNENIKEAETHNKNCGKKMDARDIDGDPNTSSHSPLDDVDFDELATKWGFYKDGKPDGDKAREYLEKAMEKNPKNTIDENIDELTDDFNDDFGGRGSRQ